MKFINEKLEETLLVALLASMTLLIGLQVFMRYVMEASLTWSEELARYLFIWATYIGVSYGVRKQAHIRVTAFSDLLPDRGQIVVRILIHLVFGLFAALVIWEGTKLTAKIYGFGQTSSSLGVPMAYVYAAPVVGFGLVVIRLIQHIVLDIARLRGRAPEADE
ncbi:TRAP transporter small permease [Celeribacter naphthalenivorans]|uniref:TRAP transporter small permease n=1 Tax=Celeribacter naphthalenivorans TaxID=1614694 RepID=UPI001CFA7A09|nr:TRAP transporter small permease [Celeribacter naphthalenivorans]